MDEAKIKQKKTLYVSNVGPSVDEAALVRLFSTFGDVLDVKIPLDMDARVAPGTPPPRREFAFVEFSSQGLSPLVTPRPG